MKKIKQWSIFGALIWLVGCSSDVELTTSFSAKNELSKGDSVIFLKQSIGKVTDVNIKDGKTVVEFYLSKDDIEKNNLHSNMAASVMHAPSSLVLYLGEQGKPLTSGIEIKALNNPLEVAAWSAEGAMSSLSDLLSSAAGSIGSFLNSEDFSGMEKQMTDLLSMFSERSSESVEQLNSGLEEIFNTFNQQSENTLDQANLLNENINQGIEQLKEQGQKELANILNQLQETLQDTVQEINPNMNQPLLNRDEPLNEQSDGKKTIRQSEAF